MRIRYSDISPDGVRIAVDWDQFVVGTSIFIPCLNTKKVMYDVVNASGLPRSDLLHRVCVEGGKYGLRVWRKK